MLTLLSGIGIANKFDGWGRGIASYGSSATKGSATNTSYAKPSQSTAVKKSLPSSDRKLLNAPPSKPSTANEKTKGVGSGAVKRYTAPSTTSNAKKTTLNSTSVSKPANKPVGKANQPLSKPKTNAAGKVIPQAQSKPGYKAKTSAAQKPSGNNSYKGPIPIGGSGYVPNRGFKEQEGSKSNSKYTPNRGFQGPLNLGGLADAKSKSTGNRTGATGGAKSSTGGYGGPINLGSLAKV
jgi:hypothetical protein